MIAILLGYGLRRAELSSLRKEHIQIRQGHWAIIDLVGKGGHICTVPMPIWMKNAVDRWMLSAKVTEGTHIQGGQSARIGLGPQCVRQSRYAIELIGMHHRGVEQSRSVQAPSGAGGQETRAGYTFSTSSSRATIW